MIQRGFERVKGGRWGGARDEKIIFAFSLAMFHFRAYLITYNFKAEARGEVLTRRHFR
jgi:hypothetical protein